MKLREFTQGGKLTHPWQTTHAYGNPGVKYSIQSSSLTQFHACQSCVPIRGSESMISVGPTYSGHVPTCILCFSMTHEERSPNLKH